MVAELRICEPVVIQSLWVGKHLTGELLSPLMDGK